MKEEKPEKLKDDHLLYLDTLREIGTTNMYGAAPYLKAQYPDLSTQDSRAILVYWMTTFSERHSD